MNMKNPVIAFSVLALVFAVAGGLLVGFGFYETHNYQQYQNTTCHVDSYTLQNTTCCTLYPVQQSSGTSASCSYNPCWNSTVTLSYNDVNGTAHTFTTTVKPSANETTVISEVTALNNTVCYYNKKFYNVIFSELNTSTFYYVGYGAFGAAGVWGIAVGICLLVAFYRSRKHNSAYIQLG